MNRANTKTDAEYLKEALETLGDVSSHRGEAAGEALLRNLFSLLEDRRTLEGRLGRLEKELAVFKESNAETSRLLEKKIEEISVLRLITDTTSRAITSHDPFNLMLQEVMGLFGADNGKIVLLNDRTGGFEVSPPREATEARQLPDAIEEVAGWVIGSRKPHLIDDVRKEPRLAPRCESDGVRSLVAFPLMLEGANVGVLVLSSNHPDAFGPETERLLHIIAGQVAIAVQNARLYAEVRKTRDYLENLVERAGDAIFTLDRSHKIVSWNNGAESIFKRDKQSAVGATFYKLMREESSASLRGQVQDIIDSGSIATIETDVVRGDGQTTQIALTLSPIRDAAGEVVGVSGIAKDITERKRVEEELRRLNEAKSSFVSTVSHELRTPLTSIKSLTEILLHEKDALPETTTERYLNIINGECDRLSGLISSLLDLQKLSAGKVRIRLEPLVLADIVGQSVDLFESVALPKRIDLTRESLSPDHMTRVLGDRKRLVQVLSNLLSNALKYTSAGGRVRVILLREDEYVKLTVSDDGPGIPATEKDKVFEKFYQVDSPVTRAGGGTGLGLAITRELVQLHGGRIWVESEEGKGSDFHVLIPACE